MTQEDKKMTFKDFETDQEVRWCPGCDDYVILRAAQQAFAELNRDREDIVVISGIGCSSRFPYYVNTYGMHSIHGRAPAVATGVKLANPDLSVWQITGDGDSLAIGGNHFIHAIRRNIDINILQFNNEIYGLTKGQFSPTSQIGLKTKSSPLGNIQKPFHTSDLVLAAQGQFFARVPGNDPKYMKKIFLEAEAHRGTSVIEILQNCVIFNDDVFINITDRKTSSDSQLLLEHGKPMMFGKEKNKGIVLSGLKLEVVTIGENGVTEEDILVHDAECEDSTLHSMIAKMSAPFPAAMGVIRSVKVATFNDVVFSQIEEAKEKARISNVDELLFSGETWTID